MATSINIARYATVEETFRALNPRTQVRHWSVGFCHADEIVVAAARFFGAHVVPTLAQEHRVQHAILELFGSDVPDQFIPKFSDALSRDPQYLRKLLHNRPQRSVVIASARPRLLGLGASPDSEMFFPFHASTQNPPNRANAGLIEGLCTIRPPIMAHGVNLSLYTALVESEYYAMLSASAASDIITARLRQLSENLLRSGAAVATLAGGAHNSRLDCTSDWDFPKPPQEDTMLTPELLGTFGACTFCRAPLKTPTYDTDFLG